MFRWLILNRDCVPNIIISHKGCIRSSQIKALNYLGAFGNNDFITIITKAESKLEYEVLRPVQNVQVNGPIWLVNGMLMKSKDERYCAGRKTKSMGSRRMMARYMLHGKLSIQEECSELYNSSVTPGQTYSLITSETCKPTKQLI